MEWTREARYTALDDSTRARYEALAAQAAQSAWRQWFHIQPPAGLLNDPNGFCLHNGEFHLFYQWFPLGPVHGLKYWYHVATPDFVRYRDVGIAIAPDHEYDSHGAYSGSALSENGKLRIAYTGNHRTADWRRIPYQLTAELHDDGRLEKHAPFLRGAPAGYTEHVRDPKIWREADGSYGLVLGAQREDQSGTVLYMASRDARGWQLRGEIDCALPGFGYMWECPDYFPLQDKDVLLFCPQGLAAEGGRFANLYQCGYLLGSFDKHTRRFTHGGFCELDHGFEFYAAQTCVGAHGERVLIAWMGLPDTVCPEAADGWAHCLTLPRVLGMENGRLRQRPHPALQGLRGTGAHDGVHFECLIDNPGGEPFALQLRGCEISYDGQALVFDRSASGALPGLETPQAGKGGHVRRFPIRQLTHLQVFSDTSSLEIFANDGEAVLGGRIYPLREQAFDIHLSAQARCTVYPLKEAVWHSTPSAKR